jgi:hypothetical protein
MKFRAGLKGKERSKCDCCYKCCWPFTYIVLFQFDICLGQAFEGVILALFL